VIVPWNEAESVNKKQPAEKVVNFSMHSAEPEKVTAMNAKFCGALHRGHWDKR